MVLGNESATYSVEGFLSCAPELGRARPSRSRLNAASASTSFGLNRPLGEVGDLPQPGTDTELPAAALHQPAG